MKTHDLATIFLQLSKILRGGPNIELDDLHLSSFSATRLKGTGDIAIGLHTLVNLSRIDKRQWTTLIEENSFPIQVRPRDASRDVLGKLLSYLENDSDARERLRQNIAKKQSQASPELLKALSTLLKD